MSLGSIQGDPESTSDEEQHCQERNANESLQEGSSLLDTAKNLSSISSTATTSSEEKEEEKKKRRALLDDSLLNHKKKKLVKRASHDMQILECVKEDMELKREFLNQQKEMDEEYKETMKVLSNNVNQLSSSITEAFSLLGGFLSTLQPHQPVSQWHPAAPPQRQQHMSGMGPSQAMNSTWAMPQRNISHPDWKVCLARPISLSRTLNFSRGSSRKIFVKQQKETIELLFSDTNTAAQAISTLERSPAHSANFPIWYHTISFQVAI